MQNPKKYKYIQPIVQIHISEQIIAKRKMHTEGKKMNCEKSDIKSLISLL